MPRSSPYKVNSRRNKQLLQRVDAAVMEAAELLRERVLDQWIMTAPFPGYKTNNFATGEAADLQIAPVRTIRGKRTTFVYSPAFREGENGPEPYPVYWEIGHLNVFTVQWEEQPIFRPALEAAYPDIRRVVARIIGTTATGNVTQRTGGIMVAEL